MAVFCNRCGAGLPASARFCSSCGAVISAVQHVPGRPLVRPRVGRQIAGVCLALAQSNLWAWPMWPGGLGFPRSRSSCRERILLVYEWLLFIEWGEAQLSG
jgi:hypothetical protein